MWSSPGQAVPSASRKETLQREREDVPPHPCWPRPGRKASSDSVRRDIVEIPGAATSPPSHNSVPSPPSTVSLLHKEHAGGRNAEESARRKHQCSFVVLVANPGCKTHSRKARDHRMAHTLHSCTSPSSAWSPQTSFSHKTLIWFQSFWKRFGLSRKNSLLLASSILHLN